MIICPYEHYPNCRGHDAGYYAGTLFFKDHTDMLQWVLDNMQENAILDMYDYSGNNYGKIEYEISSHRCVGFKFTVAGKIVARTVDDGRGNLKIKVEN